MARRPQNEPEGSQPRNPLPTVWMALVLLAPVGLENGTALVGPEEAGIPAEADTLAPSEAVGVPADPETRLPDPDEDPPIETCNDSAFNPDGYAHVHPGSVPPRAGFAVKVLDEIIPFPLMSVFVTPRQQINLEMVLTEPGSRFTVTADAGRLNRLREDRWTWTAPDQPGVTRITVCRAGDRETIQLNAFIMVPYEGEPELNGYRIGSYRQLLPFDPAYGTPEGMIEVTPAIEDLWVSPHFQLHQFVCKQPAGYPRYLTLRTRLLLKLEMLLEQVQSYGYPVTSLYVVSGYRTPFYNAAIGNLTRYSRHAYGDAADVMVDQNRDGRMDDLNQDGRLSDADAYVLSGVIESLSDRAWYRPFIGGLGIYRADDRRGAFIHVDTRGRRARW